MGKEKRGRQRGEGPFPSFFGVSVVFCEGSMTEKRAPVARCLVLHSHWEAPACPRSVASQQDDGPGRRVGGREARGWEKSTGGKGYWAPCAYVGTVFLLGLCVSGYHRSTGSCLPYFPFVLFTFLFLVFLFGTRATLIGGRDGRERGNASHQQWVAACGRRNGKDWKLEGALFFCGWWSANHKRILMVFPCSPCF